MNISYVYKCKILNTPVEAFVDSCQLNNVLDLRGLTLDNNNLLILFNYIIKTFWNEQISKIDIHNSNIDINYLKTITNKPLVI